ncbi:PAS domain S-box protein [bacterium]|nr:PAS domain S-box protein [bacterium]
MSLANISTDIPQGINLVIETLRSDLPYNFEITQRKKSGATVLVEIYASKVKYRGHLAIQSINHDITKRKQAEEALRESNDRYERLVTNAMDIIYRFKFYPNPHFEFISSAVTSIAGYTPEEHYQNPMLGLQIIHEDDRPSLEDFISGHVPEQPHTVRWLHKNGAIVWMEDRQTPIYENDKLIAVEGIARDITERKRVEEIIHKNEQQLKSIYESIADIIFQLSVEGEGKYRFISVNPRFYQITGLTKDMVMGKMVSEVIPEPALSKVLEKYTQAVEEKRIVQWEETSDYPAGQLSGEVSVTPVFDDNGHCTHLVGLVHDLTERMKTAKALAESDSLKELLLDVITHDLKNPAGVIYGLSEMARSELPENELIENIYLSSERLLGVIDNSTVLTQVTFGEKIPRDDLNLNDMLKVIVDEFSLILQTAEMDLSINIPQDTVISANPLIGEVFKNYISNAIKYAVDGKKILIEASVEKASVLISVKDFGETIPEADRDHVFERMFQTDSHKKSGRGLGLAIVKRIAIAHDGEVWVEPNIPRGNSFCLRIPQT